MKKNTFKIIATLIIIGLFIAVIVLTNDNVKKVVDTERIVPLLVIISLCFNGLVMLWTKRVKR